MSTLDSWLDQESFHLPYLIQNSPNGVASISKGDKTFIRVYLNEFITWRVTYDFGISCAAIFRQAKGVIYKLLNRTIWISLLFQSETKFFLFWYVYLDGTTIQLQYKRATATR